MDEKPMIIKRNVKYPRIEFKTGSLILILPNRMKIEIKEFLKKHWKWIDEKEKIINEVKKEVKKEKLVERQETEFYELVEKMINEFSSKLNLKIPKIRFRLMKTKWASCTKKGKILLNPILKYLPENLIRYVIFHEFCHLIVPYHNKKFWLLVSTEFQNPEILERKLLGYWFLIHEKKV